MLHSLLLYVVEILEGHLGLLDRLAVFSRPTTSHHRLMFWQHRCSLDSCAGVGKGEGAALPHVLAQCYDDGKCAGCVEALANERALLLAFWVVHRPPSATALALALRLLHALASTPAAAWSAAAQGGAVYLLTALLPTAPPSATELVSLFPWVHFSRCTVGTQ